MDVWCVYIEQVYPAKVDLYIYIYPRWLVVSSFLFNSTWDQPGYFQAMEVCFLASGETLAVLDEMEGQTAKEVKQALAAKVGISRFKQRFFVEDGSHEIPDDEVLASPQLKVQLVVLEFWPPDDEETQKMISASRYNDSLRLEDLLQRPRNPSETNKDGATPLLYAAEQGHVQAMQMLLEAGAKTDMPELVTRWTPLCFSAHGGFLDAV